MSECDTFCRLTRAEPATYREIFLAIANDGSERTAEEIASILGMNHSSQATQFLLRLKTNLVVGRCSVRIKRRVRDGKAFWELVRKC